MSPWSWSYLTLLLMVVCFSMYHKNNECKKISFILLFAFFVTRLITWRVDIDRFMFDFCNDLVAVLLLLYFVKESITARCVMVCYGLMTLFGYIPLLLGLIDLRTNYVLIDLFAFIQIIIITGGVIHGSGITIRIPGRTVGADGVGNNRFRQNNQAGGSYKDDSTSVYALDEIDKLNKRGL